MNDLRRFRITARVHLIGRDDVDRHGLLGFGPGNARSHGDAFGEAEGQRDVRRQRGRVDDEVGQRDRQPGCGHLQLEVPVAHQGARHLQRIRPSAAVVVVALLPTTVTTAPGIERPSARVVTTPEIEIRSWAAAGPPTAMPNKSINTIRMLC